MNNLKFGVQDIVQTFVPNTAGVITKALN